MSAQVFSLRILPAIFLLAILFSFTGEKKRKPENKTLILLRHAKSNRSDTTLKDFDRPLDSTGYPEAEQMGEMLRREFETVDLIVASPARRTRQTADVICRYLNYKPENIRWDSTIYLCTKEALISSIRKTDEKIKTVLFIGHNPATTETANTLQKKEHIDEVKTCGAVAIRFSSMKWQEIGEGKGELIFYRKPK